MRQTLPGVERNQTLQHGLDKPRVGLEKSVDRLLQQLVRAPPVAGRKLDKACFLFRGEAYLHQIKPITERVESRLALLPSAAPDNLDRLILTGACRIPPLSKCG